jgi:hypothetical protein
MNISLARGRSRPGVAVADDVWAVAVPGDTLVPDGWLGVSIVPGAAGQPLVQNYLPNDRRIDPRPGGKSGARHWLVRNEFFRVDFAPQPAMPEAGLSVALRPALTPYGHLCEELARWLGWQNAQQLTPADLGAELVAEPLLSTLPPCVSDDWLRSNSVAQRLSAGLRRAVGLECIGLARADLLVERGIDLCAQLASPAAAEAADRTAAARARGAGSDVPTAAPPPAPPMLDTVEFFVTDARAGERLFDELPSLADAVRRWPLHADRTEADRQRELLRRLELLAGTVNRLPTLDLCAVDARRIPPQTPRLLAAAARQAVAVLGEAWRIVDSLPAASAPGAAGLDRLDRSLTALELAVARRRQPWWEAVT